MTRLLFLPIAVLLICGCQRSEKEGAIPAAPSAESAGASEKNLKPKPAATPEPMPEPEIIPAPVKEQDKKDDKILMIIHVGSVVQMEMRSKNIIKEASIEKDDVIRLSSAGNLAKVLVTALAPGKCQVTLTGIDKKVEVVEIIVRREVALPLGVADELELPSKQRIQKVANENDKIATITLDPANPTRVRIEALTAGKTLCVLTDQEGKEESYDIFAVKPHQTIAVGQSQVFRPASGKAIRVVLVEDNKVVQVAIREGQGKLTYTAYGCYVAEGEVTAVSITGLRVGINAVTIEDTDGKEEFVVLGVVPKN